MPKSTSNSCWANETLLRSRNAMTYISSRNGSSRLKTFLVAASLSSWRWRGSEIVMSAIEYLLARDAAGLDSVHVLAAIDLNGRAIDIPAALGQQKGHGRGDLLRLPDPAERNAGRHGSPALVGEPATHDLGVDRPRRNHV